MDYQIANPLLILRAEAVCLVVLLFMMFSSRQYRIGKESKAFSRLVWFGVTHVIFDIITVCTVNFWEFGSGEISAVLNSIFHIVFYLSAILYSNELCNYVIRLCYPRADRKIYYIGYALILIYLCLLPFDFMGIEKTFTPTTAWSNGTWSSYGMAAFVGYGIALAYFVLAITLIVINFGKLKRYVKRALLPMLVILVAAEILQIVIPELLFTGGAITIVTVGFFFSLENPVHIFERKVMTDALTGVRSRHSYEQDMDLYDRHFLRKKDDEFIFVFFDINNLKAVNGMYGHQEGDRYISLIADLLQQNMTDARGIYRMGGDEFLAIYRGIEEPVVSEQILGVQNACMEASQELDYTPSVAVGYAVSGAEYKDLRDVLKTADYMMYRNKTEQKRKNSRIKTVTGTRLNLSGLTNRMFDAMCVANERNYPFITNMETGVTRISASWKDFFNLDNEFFDDFQEAWAAHIHPNDRQAYLDDLAQVLTGKKAIHDIQYRAITPAGKYVTCSCHGAIYYGKDGEADIFAGYLVNHGLEETIDAITGLPNYNMLIERMENRLKKHLGGILLKLEILNFNRVNMLYGYNDGGLLLHQIAEMLEDIVAEHGQVYSFDGKNFTILFNDLSKEEVSAHYNRISFSLSHNLQLNGTPIPLEIAGGAFEVPKDFNKEQQIIRRCLIRALDDSINISRGKLVFYQSKPGTADGTEIGLLSEIHRNAVTGHNFFRLRYQPIVDTQTGSLYGAEALLRFISPIDGEINPARFIGFLESDACFFDLGLFILRTAIRDAKEFKKLHPDFKINVNITALQLQNDSFLGSVQNILSQENYPACDLVLELTERCKELDSSFLKDKIDAIRAAGMKVALDDMGTGYSTLDLLFNLDVDEIKLDRNFVIGITDREDYDVFTSALAGSTARTGMNICFEGVENKTMLEYLKHYGHTLCQGYFFSKPIFKEDFITYMKDHE